MTRGGLREPSMVRLEKADTGGEGCKVGDGLVVSTLRQLHHDELSARAAGSTGCIRADYLSEQYSTEASGTLICFSQVALLQDSISFIRLFDQDGSSHQYCRKLAAMASSSLIPPSAARLLPAPALVGVCCAERRVTAAGRGTRPPLGLLACAWGVVPEGETGAVR